MALDPIQRALDKIAGCEDSKQLKQIAKNARSQGQTGVCRAAELKLYAILPSAQPGTLLARTRQKIARDGEQGTVASLVLGKVSDGFRMLLDRNMTDLTFEAVALRHPADFSEDVLKTAKSRLLDVGYAPK